MTSLPEARPHPTRVSRLPGSVNVVARNPKLRSCWRLQGLTSASTAPTVRLFSSSAGQDIAIGSAQEHVSAVAKKADAEVTSTADQPERRVTFGVTHGVSLL